MTELLTKAQAAELLTVSEDTLNRLIAAGKIPVYRISDKVTRLDRTDVLVYLEGRRQRADALSRAQKSRPRRTEPKRGGVNNSGYYPGMKVV